MAVVVGVTCEAQYYSLPSGSLRRGKQTFTMPLIQHLLYLIAYSGLALLAALFGPRVLPVLGEGGGLLLGLWVFLGGVVVHEMMNRRTRDERLAEKLEVLHHNQVVLRDRISWTRREMRGMAEALEAAGGTEHLDTEQSILNDALSEVNLLKTLMPRLTDPLLGLFDDEEAEVKNGEGPRAQKRQEERRAAADPASFLEDFRQSPAKGTAAQEKKGAKGPPTPADAPVLSGLSQEELLREVRRSLRDDRIDLYLQPVVNLPQRKTRFYECYSRLRTGDGCIIMPDQYMSITNEAALLTAIDNMLLFRCVQIVRKIVRSGEQLSFFVNLASATLKDHQFFSDFVDFLKGNIQLAPHLVVELSQDEFTRLNGEDLINLDRLMELGCRLSLDRLTTLEMDLEALAAGHVRFLKMTPKLLLGDVPASEAFFERLRAVPIEVVVEKVEEEDSLREVLDLGVAFGQGYLFGEPRPARP